MRIIRFCVQHVCMTACLHENASRCDPTWQHACMYDANENISHQFAVQHVSTPVYASPCLALYILIYPCNALRRPLRRLQATLDVGISSSWIELRKKTWPFQRLTSLFFGLFGNVKHTLCQPCYFRHNWYTCFCLALVLVACAAMLTPYCRHI